MSSIKDEIRIAGSVADVFAALVTQQGYRGWWNTVAEVPANVGGEARLQFTKDGRPVGMRWRIDQQDAGARVQWTCTGHDFTDWIGTTLTWQLRPAADSVMVSFEHAGWKGEPPEPVAQGWKHFLGSLKSYIETGTGQPW